jgi:hypothetical protein
MQIMICLRHAPATPLGWYFTDNVVDECRCEVTFNPLEKSLLSVLFEV